MNDMTRDPKPRALTLASLLASALAASIPLASEAAVQSSISFSGPSVLRKADPSASLRPLDGDSIEVPPGLRKHVDFWVAIYTRYYTHQGLIHDAKHVGVVYEVLDLSGPGRGRNVAAKQKWREVLLSLHRKQVDQASWPEGLSEDERKVAKLFEPIDEPNKFLAAAHRKRLRFQLGHRNHFQEGLVQSGRYLPLMEEVFRREKMPIELTRLPFVESSFNLRARSKVGASGIWQFMRTTGKLFVQVNDAVDERNDPIRATEAAARLLRLNYESLGSWPLAVTAYNHGRKGMMRAVRKVGSDDLSDVLRDYRSRSFGFASSNFFAGLLAAIEVEKNAEKHFGDIKRAPLLKDVGVALPDYVLLKDLCDFLKLEPAVVADLNPALSDAVVEGKLRIPAGYILRLPPDSKLGPEAQARLFLAGYAQIPGLYKHRAQKPI
jgi:membrane-bound lytic murein transglycosylase D